jgi:hypothetical protein
LVVSLPLDLELDAEVDSVQVSAEIRIAYRGGKGQALVRDLTGEIRAAGATAAPTADASTAKKGFFARLFGG